MVKMGETGEDRNGWWLRSTHIASRPAFFDAFDGGDDSARVVSRIPSSETNRVKYSRLSLSLSPRCFQPPKKFLV